MFGYPPLDVIIVLILFGISWLTLLPGVIPMVRWWALVLSSIALIIAHFGLGALSSLKTVTLNEVGGYIVIGLAWAALKILDEVLIYVARLKPVLEKFWKGLPQDFFPWTLKESPDRDKFYGLTNRQFLQAIRELYPSSHEELFPNFFYYIRNTLLRVEDDNSSVRAYYNCSSGRIELKLSSSNLLEHSATWIVFWPVSVSMWLFSQLSRLFDTIFRKHFAKALEEWLN